MIHAIDVVTMLTTITAILTFSAIDVVTTLSTVQACKSVRKTVVLSSVHQEEQCLLVCAVHMNIWQQVST